MQVEIDDYRDYEKACGALREAMKYLTKAETRTANDLAEHTQHRIELIERFLSAKTLAPRNIDQMIEICESLLNERHLEVIVTCEKSATIDVEAGCHPHW